MIISKSSKAFTLIELLVVIAIIAVLAGILVPVLGSVQENSRITKCSSNLRQIGAAMFLFAGEHDGYMPASGGTITWTGTDSTTNQGAWMAQLGTYMNMNTTDDPQLMAGKSVFTCPSSSLVLDCDKYYSYFNGAHAAYAQATQANGGVGTFAALKLQSIAYPSKTILSGDISHAAWPGANSGMFDADKDDFTQNPFDTKSTFHKQRVNILFADGHVETVTWNPNLSTPGYFNRDTMATHYDGTYQDNPQNSNYVTP